MILLKFRDQNIIMSATTSALHELAYYQLRWKWTLLLSARNWNHDLNMWQSVLTLGWGGDIWPLKLLGEYLELYVLTLAWGPSCHSLRPNFPKSIPLAIFLQVILRSFRLNLLFRNSCCAELEARNLLATWTHGCPFRNFNDLHSNRYLGQAYHIPFALQEAAIQQKIMYVPLFP